jgi:hypothetical protein
MRELPLGQLRVLMLPVIGLAGWIGAAYLFGDAERTATPSFAVAQSLAPMWAWGVLFLTGAVALSLATVLGNFMLIGAAMFVGGIIYTWWGSLFAATAVGDPRASLVGPAVYYFIGSIHFVGAWRMYTREG